MVFLILSLYVASLAMLQIPWGLALSLIIRLASDKFPLKCDGSPSPPTTAINF